jgi:hypothetical protein
VAGDPPTGAEDPDPEAEDAALPKRLGRFSNRKQGSLGAAKKAWCSRECWCARTDCGCRRGDVPARALRWRHPEYQQRGAGRCRGFGCSRFPQRREFVRPQSAQGKASRCRCLASQPHLLPVLASSQRDRRRRPCDSAPGPTGEKPGTATHARVTQEPAGGWLRLAWWWWWGLRTVLAGKRAAACFLRSRRCARAQRSPSAHPPPGRTDRHTSQRRRDAWHAPSAGTIAVVGPARRQPLLPTQRPARTRPRSSQSPRRQRHS